MNANLMFAVGVGTALLGTGLALVLVLFPQNMTEGARQSRLSVGLLKLKATLGPRTLAELLVGVALGAVLAVLVDWPAYVVLVPVLVLAIPRLFSARAEKAATQKLVDLETWTRSLTGLLGSGHSSMVRSVLLASQSAASGAMQEPVRWLVARLDAGWTTSDAIKAFADDLDDSTADLVAMHLLAAASNPGPGLREALNSVADTVADEAQSRRKLSAERGRSRMNARIVFYITAALILVIPLVPALKNGYSTPMGTAVFAAVACYLGLVVMRMERFTAGKPLPRLLTGGSRA